MSGAIIVINTKTMEKKIFWHFLKKCEKAENRVKKVIFLG
jgi:hypothetical protein